MPCAPARTSAPVAQIGIFAAFVGLLSQRARRAECDTCRPPGLSRLNPFKTWYIPFPTFECNFSTTNHHSITTRTCISIPKPLAVPQPQELLLVLLMLRPATAPVAVVAVIAAAAASSSSSDCYCCNRYTYRCCHLSLSVQREDECYNDVKYN